MRLKTRLDKFRKQILELSHSKKIKETWYLWFPWPNILFTIIATCLVGRVSFSKLLDFGNQKQCFVLILLILFSILKSCLISGYTVEVEQTIIKKFSVLSFIYHLFPSFFLIWTFYINWSTWVILLLLLFDLLVCFSSNWLMKRKVHAHILADLASLVFFGGISFANIDIENQVAVSILVLLLVTLRWLLIDMFYNGVHIKSLFSWTQKPGQFDWFSELLSTGIFLSALATITEEISKEISLVVLLPSVFVYYLFLYLRLFLYKQYGILYKELYYFVTMGGGILLYIWVINWVKIDIIVWFFPAVIILVLDDFIYLSHRKYTNRMVELSMRGKQLFSKLKLFSLVSLFLYHILLENKQDML